MVRSLTLAVALSSAVLLTPAHAQSPAAPAPAPTVVAPHKCEKPEIPGRLAPETRIRKWSVDFKVYGDCLKAYIAERNAVIEAQGKAAKATVDEFNASVHEFNEAVKALND
jgi:hypothetical protein